MAKETSGVAIVAIVVLVVIAAVFFYMVIGQEENDIEIDVPDIDIDASIGEYPSPGIARLVRI
jgi:hypothetical protein